MDVPYPGSVQMPRLPFRATGVNPTMPQAAPASVIAHGRSSASSGSPSPTSKTSSPRGRSPRAQRRIHSTEDGLSSLPAFRRRRARIGGDMNRTLPRRVFLRLLAAAGSLALLQACASAPVAQAPATSAPASGGTAASPPPPRLPPPALRPRVPRCAAGPSGWASSRRAPRTPAIETSPRALYNSLIRADENGNLTGELAETWRIVDPQTYIFSLRKESPFTTARSSTPTRAVGSSASSFSPPRRGLRQPARRAGRDDDGVNRVLEWLAATRARTPRTDLPGPSGRPRGESECGSYVARNGEPATPLRPATWCSSRTSASGRSTHATPPREEGGGGLIWAVWSPTCTRPGVMRIPWFSSMLTRWAGPNAWIRKLGFRNREWVLVCYMYYCRGRVLRTFTDGEQHFVEVPISGSTSSGR